MNLSKDVIVCVPMRCNFFKLKNKFIVFLEMRQFQTGSMVIKWPQNMFFNNPPIKLRDEIVLPITILKNAMERHDELE